MLGGMNNCKTKNNNQVHFWLACWKLSNLLVLLMSSYCIAYNLTMKNMNPFCLPRIHTRWSSKNKPTMLTICSVICDMGFTICGQHEIQLGIGRRMRMRYRAYLIWSAEPPFVALLIAHAASFWISNSAVDRRCTTCGMMFASITACSKDTLRFEIWDSSTSICKKMISKAHPYTCFVAFMEYCGKYILINLAHKMYKYRNISSVFVLQIWKTIHLTGKAYQEI